MCVGFVPENIQSTLTSTFKSIYDYSTHDVEIVKNRDTGQCIELTLRLSFVLLFSVHIRLPTDRGSHGSVG